MAEVDKAATADHQNTTSLDNDAQDKDMTKSDSDDLKT